MHIICKVPQKAADCPWVVPGVQNCFYLTVVIMVNVSSVGQ